MKAVIVEDPNRIVIRDTGPPSVGPYDALVRVEAGCICNSSDRKVVEHHFPGYDDYPAILGHETVGTVVEIGGNVRSFKPGQRVVGALNLNPPEEGLFSAWGAFGEYALAGDHAAMVADGVADEAHGWVDVFQIVKAVPDDIANEDAVMLCTWREVLGGFSDFGLARGKNVLIFGGGPVGQSFVRLAKLRGLSPIVMTDRIDWKMGRARDLGANVTISADDDDFIGKAKEHAPDGFDYVIDAVGSPAIMNTAMKLVRMAGNICVYGTVPADTITLDKSPAPYNWNLLFHQWPTREYESAAHEPLCEMIREGQISAETFITHRYPIGRIDEAIDEVRRGHTLKVFLEFDW